MQVPEILVLLNTRVSDTAYRVGQRLVIREDVVRKCLPLMEKLAVGIATDGSPCRAACKP